MTYSCNLQDLKKLTNDPIQGSDTSRAHNRSFSKCSAALSLHYASTLFIQTTRPSGELNRTSVKSALTTPHNEPGANTGNQTLSNKPTEHDETLTNTSPDRFAAKQYSTSNNISRPNTNNYTTKTQPTDKLNNAHNHTMAKNSTRQIPRTKLNLSMCAFHLYKQHIPTVNNNASKRNRTTHKEMKSHTHTRVVVSKMGRVVVISQEALPWVCPSQNRGGRF